MSSCRGCGKPFQPSKRSQRYHDPACQHRHQQIREALRKKDLRQDFTTADARVVAGLIRWHREHGAFEIRVGRKKYFFAAVQDEGALSA